jgi:hypothetical protein
MQQPQKHEHLKLQVYWNIVTKANPNTSTTMGLIHKKNQNMIGNKIWQKHIVHFLWKITYFQTRLMLLHSSKSRKIMKEMNKGMEVSL